MAVSFVGFEPARFRGRPWKARTHTGTRVPNMGTILLEYRSRAQKEQSAVQDSLRNGKVIVSKFP